MHYKIEPYKGKADHRKIDVTVRDSLTNDILAFFWGDDLETLTLECNHTEVECDDPSERGTCLLCGAECDWGYDEDEFGHKYPCPRQWYEQDVNPVIIYKRIMEAA